MEVVRPVVVYGGMNDAEHRFGHEGASGAGMLAYSERGREIGCAWMPLPASAQSCDRVVAHVEVAGDLTGTFSRSHAFRGKLPLVLG